MTPRPASADGGGEHIDLALAEVEARLQRGEAEHALLEARALVQRLRDEGAPPDMTVRAMCHLGGAYMHLGHYGDAVAFLDDAGREARAAGLEAEVVRMGVTAAAVLATGGQPDKALGRLKSVKRELEALVKSPDGTTMKAVHNFAFLSMDLGLHTVAETWFERLIELRDHFASPKTGLHSLSAYARLRVEMGLVDRYHHRDEQALLQFREASRLGRQLVEQSDDEVWRHTGSAFDVLAAALSGRRIATSGRQVSLWNQLDSQTNKHLRCVIRFASAAVAAAEQNWALVQRECATALSLANEVGFTLFGIELHRMTALAARAEGNHAAADEMEALWAAEWRSYEWAARMHAAEFVAL